MPTISKEQCVIAEINAYISAQKNRLLRRPTSLVETAEFELPVSVKIGAKVLMCVCATSSPSERLFSKSGQIVTTSRATLKPDRVNMLAFLSIIAGARARQN